MSVGILIISVAMPWNACCLILENVDKRTKAQITKVQFWLNILISKIESK